MRPDNRSALLAGARRCLDRRGYARTTAREIAAEAGVSLAAIGYHFGSTDALLVEALRAGIEEWSTEVGGRLRADDTGGGPWGVVLASLDGYRGVLAASYELIARADDSPEVRGLLRDTVEQARLGLAAQLAGVDPTSDPDRARTVGRAAYAVLSGLVVQWLVDPGSVADAGDLADGLRALVDVNDH